MPPTQSPTQRSAGVVAFTVKVNGAEVPGAFGKGLQSVEVERTYNRPDLCTVVYHAAEVSAEKPLPSFKPGNELSIAVQRQDGAGGEVFAGEITTIELDGRNRSTQYVLRAYDKRHRLYRDTLAKTYLNMKASDVMSQLFSAHGMSATVSATKTTFPYLVQNGISNGDFLEQLLQENGYVSVSERTRFACKPLSEFNAEVATLTFGDTLDAYTFRRSAQSWVKSVEVSDWDPKTKKAVKGVASAAKSVLHAQKTNGNDFGASTLRLSKHAVDQTAATTVAQAAMERALAGSLELEGQTDGNEKLVPGGIITIEGIDSTYNGKYRLSLVRHRWDGESGFVTDFSCNASTDATLTNLLAGVATSGAGVDHVARQVQGVATAIVTDSNDPENLGRVKVSFPWLPQNQGVDISSDWVRVASPGAGVGKKGWHVVPEVSDEVLVAFEHGDPRRPYVIGGLYNSADKPPLTSAEAVKSGKTPQKVFQSVKGHRLTFDDSEEKPGVELTTPGKQLRMFLDDKKGDLTLTAKASGTTITVTAAGDVTIKSENGGVTIQAMKDITMKATGNIKLEATQNVSIKASMNATVEGTTKAEVKGTLVDVKATGVATVGGAMVKIN